MANLILEIHCPKTLSPSAWLDREDSPVSAVARGATVPRRFTFLAWSLQAQETRKRGKVGAVCLPPSSRGVRQSVELAILWTGRRMTFLGRALARGFQ